MLHIQKDYLDFPHIIEKLPLPSLHRMQLTPALDDDDDLTRAIKNDVQDHDDNWQLGERPNPDELTQFWTDVEKEITKDPDWSFEE
ncbi:MAG TPA: hypothetical protein VH144_01270 [Candidatus Saccharimonadales bacterium]|jgi:hypothetical protein|nr:hypothetical protein [Candidatus Saccharimonadales bacterium]